MTGVIPGDARALPLADESVACIVTSPPYNVGIEYEGYDDNAERQTYLQLVYASCAEMRRVLVPGGRAWVNVMPSAPVAGSAERESLVLDWLLGLRQAGLAYRDVVVWAQDAYDGACGWGSWRRPSAPNLRGCYEVVLSFYKPPYKRTPPAGFEKYQDEDPADGGTAWQELVRNVWTINPVRRREGAPAPYPPELVSRCVRLSTWPGEVVLDPFAGSGTTIDVAEKLGRVGIGFDIGKAP